MPADLEGGRGDSTDSDPSLPVARRAYRLRLLNASNSRIYKLAWRDGKPLTVIGNDGGLLAGPLQRDYVMPDPAQRLDVWVDFARWPADAEPVLRSLAFESGMAMRGMMMGSSALPDGAAFPVLRFRVGKGGSTAATLPRRLSNVSTARPRSAVNLERPRAFNLTMRMMTWGINGKSFEMLATSPLETVKLGTEEIWEFRNDGLGAMMAMPHSECRWTLLAAFRPHRDGWLRPSARRRYRYRSPHRRRRATPSRQ